MGGVATLNAGACHLFFDGDLVLDVIHAFDILGDYPGPALLGLRIDKTIELHHALERIDFDVFVLVERVISQRFFDVERKSAVINIFARALLVTTAGGAAGEAADERQCAQTKEQSQGREWLACAGGRVGAVHHNLFDLVF